MFDNSTTKFEDSGYVKYSPRQVDWSVPEREKIMHYHYDPTTLGPMKDVLPYYKYMYAMKYATPEDNKELLEAYDEGIREHNGDIPHNHVEWQGRLFDCARQPQTDRLCSDPIYSNPVMAKCAAQGKYLGRTNASNTCSLNGNTAPNFYDDEGRPMIPSGVSIINGNQVYHDFEDADRAGLLTNNPVMKKDCDRQYQVPVSDSLDFWSTHSWDTMPKYKRNF